MGWADGCVRPRLQVVTFDERPRPTAVRTRWIRVGPGADARGVILVLLAAVGWSLAGLFTRMVHLTSWAIIGWRGVVGAVAVAAWLKVRSGPRSERGRGWRSVWAVGRGGLLLASLSTVATVLYIPALQVTTVANVVVVYATCPFVTALAAWLFLRERPTGSTVLAASVAVVGVALTAGGGMRHASSGDLWGLVMAAGMTVGLAGVAVCGRRYRTVSQVPATAVSAVQLAVIGLVLAPDRWISGRDVAVVVVFGLVQAASLACYIEGARLLPAPRTAVLSTADIPLAPLWVWLAFGEVPAVATAAGGLVVLAAVVWNSARA